MGECEHRIDHVTGTKFSRFKDFSSRSYPYSGASQRANAPSWPYIQITACRYVGSGGSASN